MNDRLFSRFQWAIIGFFGLSSLIGTLSGCAVGPDFKPPAAPNTNTYLPAPSADTASKGLGSENQQHASSTIKLQSDWWKIFQSDALNQLVNEALRHNASLDAATQTLRQSQHNLQAGYGVFFPEIDAGLSATRERNAPVQQGLKTPSSIFNVVSLSGMINYPLDLFGGARRALEGLQAQTEYQQYVTQAAYLSITSNVVNTAISRAAYQKQVTLTKRLIDLQQDHLKAIQTQVTSGVATYSAELAIRNAIAANQAQLAPLEQQLSASENLLATLLGQLPANRQLPNIDLAQLSLPQELPLSLPSDLVRQRPDILQSEALLHSASANVGVATAALYPSINLTGDFGRAGTNLGNLGGDNGKFWSIGSALSIPIFRGGTLWFEKEAAVDAFHVAEANYRQTVLNAFAQVANVLNAIEHDANLTMAQTQAKSYAEQNLQLTQAGYQAGINSFIDVLAVDEQTQQTTITYWAAVAQRYQDTVALYAALGGGWWAQ